MHNIYMCMCYNAADRLDKLLPEGEVPATQNPQFVFGTLVSRCQQQVFQVDYTIKICRIQFPYRLFVEHKNNIAIFRMNFYENSIIILNSFLKRFYVLIYHVYINILLLFERIQYNINQYPIKPIKTKQTLNEWILKECKCTKKNRNPYTIKRPINILIIFLVKF